MGSNNEGKAEVAEWIREKFPEGATCLDVGAGDGRWENMLGDHLVMDAVEIFEPYVEQYDLKSRYRNVFVGDIADYAYEWYDLIIFGDVIEHMTVEQAQKALAYAHGRCKDVVIAVPFRYRQGEVHGNKWQIHIQDDLTAPKFDERYPGYKIICRPRWDYAYYAKDIE